MSTRRSFQTNRLQQRRTTTQQQGQSTTTGDEEIVNISEVATQAADFYQKNQKTLLTGLVGIVLLIGGYLAYKYLIQIPNEKEAVAAMYQAELQFSRDSFAAALTKPGGQNLGFEEIVETYGGTKAGNTAKFYAGVCNLNLGKYAEAIEYLEDFSPSDNITPAVKYGALGDAYSESNDFDKALSYYEKAAKADDNEFTAPFYLNKLGLLQFAKKNNDGALATFKKIMEKYPTSQEAREAERMIERLEK